MRKDLKYEYIEGGENFRQKMGVRKRQSRMSKRRVRTVEDETGPKSCSLRISPAMGKALKVFKKEGGA